MQCLWKEREKQNDKVITNTIDITGAITENKKPYKHSVYRVLLFFALILAEKKGFEPSIRFRIHAFQACAFDHSATSLNFMCSNTCQLSPQESQL